MPWHWSDPDPVDPEAYDVELEVSKGTDNRTILTGTVTATFPADIAAALEELFAPAVANGWVLTATRVQRQRPTSHLIYGG